MVAHHMVDPICVQRNSAREMKEPAQENIRELRWKNCQVRVIMFDQTYLTEQHEDWYDRVPGPVAYQGKQLQREGAEDYQHRDDVDGVTNDARSSHTFLWRPPKDKQTLDYFSAFTTSSKSCAGNKAFSLL